MKKLLITGSNGFVGSYFIKKYKDKYDIKTFSFLKNDINTLDCDDIEIVYYQNINNTIIEIQNRDSMSFSTLEEAKKLFF